MNKKINKANVLQLFYLFIYFIFLFKLSKQYYEAPLAMIGIGDH